jgi:uncharacterized protein YjiS (DUF1127 family)
MEKILKMTTDTLCAKPGLALSRPTSGIRFCLRLLVGHFLAARAAMRARAQMRHMLAHADQRLFADLGVSRAQAAFEASCSSKGPC